MFPVDLGLIVRYEPSECLIYTYTSISQHKHVVSELQKLRVEKEQLLQQNHEYQTQVKVTKEEVSDLSSEVELLKGKLKEAQTSAGWVSECVCCDKSLYSEQWVGFTLLETESGQKLL